MYSRATPDIPNHALLVGRCRENKLSKIPTAFDSFVWNLSKLSKNHELTRLSGSIVLTNLPDDVGCKMLLKSA